jgi:DNA invertase Pin-like site-specific DNA recombinase
MLDEELDVTKLKYVMYVRKSSEAKDRQARSIKDQISDCKIIQERYGLNVLKVIKEEKSAKTPRKRVEFTQMLKDIKKGEYNAILAWNPDRLARNMREGGLIIDMIDEGYIQDLKFVTHHFSNDANGKMLLGMAFVLSKQYSDDLSQKVTRGVRKRFAEGRTPVPKYGYLNKEGLYYPDGDNHQYIKDAWDMKLEGKSHKVIADKVNSLGFHRIIKKTKRKTYMTPQKLSEMFRDPFYYGVLVQANQRVDLREIYGFVPAVEEDDFFRIQQQSRVQQIPYKTKKRLAFYPLKRIVKCSYCGGNMYIAPSTSGDKKTRLLYCRCDNKQCPRKEKGIKRSVRMKVVLDFIYDLLEGGLNFTEKEYNDYYGNLKQISDKKRAELRTLLNNKQGSLKFVNAELKELSLSILKSSTNKTAKEYGEQEIEDKSIQKEELEKEIQKLKEKLEKSEVEEISLEQFLNLSKNAPVVVKNGTPAVKDAICRFIFLNIDVGDDEILSYQLKEPFHTLFKQREKSNGRGDRTRSQVRVTANSLHS